MNLVFNKRQIISLIILLSLVFILPFGLFLVRQRQEVRKRAEETRKEIALSLEPQTNDQTNPWGAGHEQTITVKMRNLTSDKTLQFRVIGLELNFNPQVFESKTADLSCNSPFVLAGGSASKVENGLISLVCYVPPAGAGPSQPQTLAPGAQKNVGSFKVKVKSNPPGTSTDITFVRSNIPEETTLEDLSKYSEKRTYTYYIAGTPITGTPTPTSTPTPTTTPPPGECPNGENGNLNCDAEGLINAGDLSILLTKWSPEGPVPTPNPGQRSADIVVDGAVNAGDLGKLLGHWKVE